MQAVSFPGDRSFDAVPVGRVAIDFNPTEYFKSLVEIELFKKYVGGSPANTAIGLSRLGEKVGFIGKLSNDRLGDYVLDVFRREGIDTSCLTRVKGQEKLGLAFTDVLSEKEMGIIMYRDGVADLALAMEDVRESYVKSARSVIISGTALTASPSREACFKIMRHAKACGTTLVFDIDFRPYGWASREEAGVYFSLAAEKSDIIMGSREEFDLAESFLGLDGSDDASAAHWLKGGAGLLLIKHGKQGSNAFAVTGERYRIRPIPVKAVKSTGGGDGYSSAMLHGLLRGWPLRDCLEFGNASASMLVASHACSADMPTEERIREFIRESKGTHGEVVTEMK